LASQADKLEQFVADSAAGVALNAICGREELEVFEDLHFTIHPSELRHVIDHPANFLRLCINGIAANIGLAPGRL
jgi:hypothetical protein